MQLTKATFPWWNALEEARRSREARDFARVSAPEDFGDMPPFEEVQKHLSTGRGVLVIDRNEEN